MIAPVYSVSKGGRVRHARIGPDSPAALCGYSPLMWFQNMPTVPHIETLCIKCRAAIEAAGIEVINT